MFWIQDSKADTRVAEPLEAQNRARAECRVRYGFIVTDDVVVVLRLARLEPGPGLAVDRSARLAVSGSQGGDSQGPESSLEISDPSSSQVWSSSFEDDNPLNWDFKVQHQVIPWSAHGAQLTGKLALWALAMMSLHGDSYIDRSYPSLNTWREVERRRIVHNTSGEIRARSTRAHPHTDCVMQEPNSH